MIPRTYIKRKFGSSRGFLAYIASEIARLLGSYRAMEKANIRGVKRLVFICSGNICRSPLGEAVAKKNGVAAVSFGLDTRGGDSADPRAIAYAAQQGYELTAHRTRNIKEYQPEAGDLLIGMEPKHIERLKALYGDKVQMTLAGLWLEKPIAYIHDPYNTNPEFFTYCSSLVELASSGLAMYTV